MTTKKMPGLQYSFGFLFALLGVALVFGSRPAAAQSVSVSTTTASPLAVIVGATGDIDASASYTGPTLASNETISSSTITYAWGATYGTCSPTDGTSTTDTVSFSTPGTYNEVVTCTVTYSYQILSTDYGNQTPPVAYYTTTTLSGQVTGSVTVQVNANPIFLIQVARAGTTNFGGSAIIGANDGDESTATVQVTAEDASHHPVSGWPVSAPSVTGGTGVYIDADIGPGTVSTDTYGNADFTFDSSDEVTSVTVSISGAGATVDQHWDDSGAVPVPAEDTFDYGQTIDVSYTVSYTDSNSTTVPLDGHDIDFDTTSISGWEWNGTKYVPSNLTTEAEVAADTNALNAVTYTCSSTSGGSYPGTLTVSDSGYYAPDEFTFDAEDDGTFPAP